MSQKNLAAVAVGERQTEVREFDIPEIPEDAGLLRIEAAGMCGADWPKYLNGNSSPKILGHENVGYIEKVGRIARERWGVKEGDRVALEEYIPCGQCRFCRSGYYRSCLATDTRRPNTIRYGSTPIDVAPSLWGGYSQYMYLHPNTVLHKIPNHVPAEQAALTLPIANGIEWAYLEGGAGPGKVVVIQGPGQQGLGCAIAAKAAGASCVIVSGLAKDQKRLEVAGELGADYVVNVDEENLIDRVREVTGGEMADISMDVSSGGTVTVENAFEVVKKRGTVILGASKKKPVPNFNSDQIISKNLLVKGVRGHSYTSVEMALDNIASQKYPLEKMCTNSFELEEVDEALRTLGGEINIGAIHCTVFPWGKKR